MHGTQIPPRGELLRGYGRLSTGILQNGSAFFLMGKLENPLIPLYLPDGFCCPRRRQAFTFLFLTGAELYVKKNVDKY
jgi:hypothetical protein